MTDDERSPDAAADPEWARLAWLADEPALAALLRAPAIAPPTVEDTERALARVIARRQRPAHRSGARGHSRWRHAGWAAAAALVVVAGVGWAHRDAPSASRAAQAVSEAPGRALVTGIGQLDSIRLADGTRVLLGPSSVLDTTGMSEVGERVVRLRGEGSFDVVHDTRRPFTVRTAAGTLRDIGTRFVVNTETGAGLRVTVESGAVGLRGAGADGAERRVNAGDRATIAVGGEVRVERGAATAADAAWTHGRIVLRDADMPEVTIALRRWYGVVLRVEDQALARRRITATFGSESGADAGRIVAATLGGVARVAGDTVIVTARPPASP